MATLSSVLARKIPRTEEPGGLRSMGLRTVGHNCEIERCHGQGCFHVLATVSSGAVNTGARVFSDCVFLWIYPRGGIAGSYGSSVFSFFFFLRCVHFLIYFYVFHLFLLVGG